MFSKFYPAFLNMIMAFNFPAFIVHGEDSFKVTFPEVERGDDLRERLARLRERFEMLASQNPQRLRLDVSLFFPPDVGGALYAKEVMVFIVRDISRCTKIHITVPRTNCEIRVVVTDEAIYIENRGDARHIRVFEHTDKAVEYIQKVISEQGQMMSDSLKMKRRENSMSNWTHVAGIIRIDDFRFEDTIFDFDKLIGKELHFEDCFEKWHDARNHPEKYLPQGSEGSLKKNVWINPDKEEITAYTVSIFGDLRDHDDPQEIVDWFKKICGRFASIRNAVIVVENEINGQRSWAYPETL